MRRLMLLFLAVLPPAFARAGDAPVLLDREATLRAAASVTQAKYPDADTVLVDDFVKVTYQPDGTDEVWDDTYTKVLTEKGREEARQLTLGYNLVYDTITVVRVEVVKPDGRAVDVDIAAQSQTMADRGQMQMNIYDPNDRTLQVGIPDLDVGDVVHYVTHHRTKKTRMPDTWVDYQVFEYTSPILRYTYEVNAPAARPLQRVELKDAVPGTVTATTNRSGDRIVYRWEIRDVPRIFEEPNMPEYYSCVQRLLVSTVPDWQTVSKWYWGISAPHLEATTPELVAKVRELTGGGDTAVSSKGDPRVAATGDLTEREKIQRLFTFVSQQIRYMGITTEKEAPGYEPHDVSITFGQKYGVCRDKAALLAAMLRLAGLRGFPVLINAGPKKDVGVPQPYFNHAIVAAQTADGEYVLMDPTDENSADLLPSYLCDMSYLVARPEGETLRTSPIIPATNNLLRVATRGKLDARGLLKLESTLRFEGINDNAYRGFFATIGPDERRKFFDTRLGQMLPGARLTELAIEPANLRDTTLPFSVRLACEVPDYFVESDTHRLLSLPWIGHGFGTVNHVLGQTGLDKRRFPLRTEIACGVEEAVELELADAAAPLAMPHVPEIARDDLEFRLGATVASNRAGGKAAFLLKAVEYTPDRYAALKQSLRDMEYARRQRVVLPQAVAAAAANDAEVLKRDITIEVKNGREWITTEEQTIRILTYAGKKRLSELHLDFNPAWESVSLTNVTVTGRDGKVQTLAAQELNLMDAEWVASAPRYPAARTLVASLPGVDVGSDIRYTVVRHRRDRPFFSTVAVFRGFDPIREATMTVVAPASLQLREWTRGDGFAVSATTNAGLVTRSWRIANQPSLFREENMPPLWSFCPTVALSAGDWKDYAEEMIGPMVKAAKGNPEARKLAKQVARKGRTKFDKATAIRDAVARGVRLAGPQADDLPVSILTPADVTLREGYGNSRDRALLLYVMLDEAGFKPEFVLTSSGCPTIPELRDPWLAVPQGSTFDTVLVCAKMENDLVYFNDTDQYAHLGSTPHEGRPGLRRDGSTGAISTPDRNFRSTVHRIAVGADGDAVISVEQQFEGMNYASFNKQLAEQTPEERRRYAQELAAMISQGAKLDGELLVDCANYPGSLRFKVAVPRFAVRENGFLYLGLPQQHALLLPGSAAERRSAVYLESRSVFSVDTVVALPRGELSVVPSTQQFYAPLSAVRLQAEAGPSKDGTTFELEHHYEFKPALIPAHRYDELKEWNARVRHPANRSFMLKLAE